MKPDQLSRRELFRLGALGTGVTVIVGCADLGPSSKTSRSPTGTTQHDKNTLRDFVALSETLTGFSPLDPHLAAQYLGRYAANPIVGPYLQDLLAAFKSILLLNSSDQPAALQARMLEPTAVLRPAAEQLVYLWYTSAFAFRDQSNVNKIIWEYGDEHQYNEALVWKVIHGHPMMTTPSDWIEAPLHRV